MNTILAFIKRHSFAVFVVLAYLLSWWSAPFANGQIIPYGPAVAAVILLALVSGRSGVRELGRRITHWRIAWYWYLIAPGLVAAYMGAAYLLNLLIGAGFTNPPHLPSAGIILELLLLGGLWEEPGWSGFLLPKFQRLFARHPKGILAAALATGLIRSIWHLPLLIYGHIYWFDLLFYSLALQIMITWLFNRTGGSVLIVMVYHFAANLIGGGIMSPVFTGAARTSYFILMVALAVIIAVAILLKSNLKLGQESTKSIPAVVEQRVVQPVDHPQ